jgi:putative methyltransferase
MSRQYINASRALDSVFAGNSLKSYCARVKVGKIEYALICETLKFSDILLQLFDSCSISAESLDVRKSMLLVFAYELLFGTGKISGGGAVKRVLMPHKPRLEDALSSLLISRGVSSPSELIHDQFTELSKMPVYVRLNRLKDAYASGYELLQSLFPKAIRDTDIPDLVVLPAGSKVWDIDLVQHGQIIIQDKASCMPSQILFDSWRQGDLIDACAAPGNKTSHLASLTASANAKIFAFDLSKKRCSLLESRMRLASAESVFVENKNFLEVNISDPKYSNVTAILVDPSCSGSGVIRSLDRVYERVNVPSNANLSNEVERLSQLRAFQVSAVLKAMSFPSVKSVVYSTCSVHQVMIGACFHRHFKCPYIIGRK